MSSPLSPPSPLRQGGEVVMVRTDFPCHFCLTEQELAGDVAMAGSSGMSPGDTEGG